MGLLEDAIREHLELKRRRGADPGEVARAEHEALEPIVEAAPRPAGELDLEPGPIDEGHGHDLVGADGGPMDPPGAYEEHPGAERSSVGQDTAELDMLTVLGDGHEDHALPGPLDTVAAARTSAEHSAGRPLEDEALEWEVPARAPSEHPAADLADSGGGGDGRRRITDGPPRPEQEHALGDAPTHAEISGQERLTFE